MPKNRQVNLFGHTIRVIFAPAVSSDNTVVFGAYHKESLEIYVSTGYALTQQRATLLHEILHAIEDLCGAKHMDFSDEEARVRYIETQLFNVLTDPRNAWARDFIWWPQED